MPAILTKAIRTPKFQPGKVAQEIRNQVRKEGRQVKAEYNKVVRHWTGDRPTFKQSQTVAPTQGGTVSVTIFPEGSEHALNKLKWLDFGTDVRYAKMLSPFERITHPHTLQTNPGFSSGIFLDMNNPADGIEPRDWTILIEQMFIEQFRRNVRNAMYRGWRKARK